ncbi:DUF6161 domain-containing protein [Vibrio astriarenae]
MSDKTETTNEALSAKEGIKLSLLPQGRTRFFESHEALTLYIENESSNWNWLRTDQRAQDKSVRSQISRMLSEHLNELKSIASAHESGEQEAIESTIRTFENRNELWPIPSSESSEGKYIINLAKHDDVSAAQILLICMTPNGSNGKERNFTNFWTPFSSMVLATSKNTAVRNEYISLEPYRIKAYAAYSNAILYGNAQNRLAQSADLEAQIEHARDKCVLSAKEFSDWCTQKKFSIDTDIQNLRKETSVRFLAFAKRILKRERKRLNMATAQEKNALTSLKNADEAYRSKIDLDESVTYWQTKQNEHETSRNTWNTRLALAVATVALIPFATLAIQWGLIEGGLIAREEFFLKTVHPMVAVISIILLSLGSYTIRFSSQQYQSQQHLYLEAVERRTMIKTYLALMSEGRLDGHEDRKIALDTLFRPSQTGIVNDSAPILPTEQIVKIVGTRMTTK